MAYLDLTQATHDRLVEFSKAPELEEYPDLRIKVDNMITHNEFLAATIEGLVQNAQEHGIEPEARPNDGTPKFTVGSLIDKD